VDFKYIFNLYKSSDNLRKLQSHLQLPQKEPALLSGMMGSMPAMVAAALYEACQPRMVFVLPDREEAAYFLNDMENILGERNALLFPSTLKKQ
jgi:transcription-repair coupling factor (superfamily II helicase)